jgi:hypothetical protein
VTNILTVFPFGGEIVSILVGIFDPEDYNRSQPNIRSEQKTKFCWECNPSRFDPSPPIRELAHTRGILSCQ